MPIHEYKVDTNLNINGQNEVHRDDCSQYPGLTSNELLGEHISNECAIGLANAKNYNAVGCPNCMH